MLRLDEPVLFLDRSLGKHIIVERLRAEGMRAEVHDDHLESDAPDEQWIELVAAREWVAVTRDKNIRYRASEIEAIRLYGAAVVVVRMKNATGLSIAQTLVDARRRIASFIARTPPPFVAGMNANGSLKEYSNVVLAEP